jgi:hypothetical protein
MAKKRRGPSMATQKLLASHGKPFVLPKSVPRRKSTCPLAPLKGKRRFTATWTQIVQGGGTTGR